ncbi:eukaryotic peptide chain release factor subunit 1-like [Mya arenaria]|uniref:eukaryotic peptide chain release factor subunit 1-like n=1 Tax=Mya arenaria TaxID=6604 RepID=UPI0022E7680E|nr:eukaryotic peptide chain release factor subunit 1-like [Mya arenaria]
MATSGMHGTANGADQNVELWRMRRLIQRLDAARGNGTSMISLVVPAGGQVVRATRLLEEEVGTAACIKSQVNRLSVEAAIASVRQRLKLYSKVPANGLVIYCGSVLTDGRKSKKVTIDFEPCRPLNKFMYLCDSKFHTEPLKSLLEDDVTYGFIVVDGKETLYGTLSGSNKTVLHSFKENLPKKHGRGGQSAMRFARIRMEKRHHYLRKVAEGATAAFLADGQVNVHGLVLAGLAHFKTELSRSDMFDPRLQERVLKVVDVGYGGESGFNQAIELAAPVLSNVTFLHEKRLIGRYFDEISQDTGRFCFGVDDTLRALEMGAVSILIVWENLDITRYLLKNHQTDGTEILCLSDDQMKDRDLFQDQETGVELELQESMPLLEWFANNYKNFGSTLEIVTDKSQEGAQFVKGFGGIGGLLRYKVEFEALQPDIANEFDLEAYN